jgi:hypothetical protein
MTFYQKVGSFTAPAGAGSQATTGLGFTPVAIIFWFGAASLSSGGWVGGSSGYTGGNQSGIGLVTASGSGAVGYIEYSNGTADIYTAHATTAIYSYSVAGTLSASLTSLDSSGFTLYWMSTISGVTIHYLALGGTDITGAMVKEWTAKGSTGSQSITGVGFKPSLVINIGTSDTVAPPHVSASTNFWPPLDTGAMDGSGNQWAQSDRFYTNCCRYELTNACIVGINQTTGVDYQAAYTSMDSDGFTINWSTCNGAPYFYSLCLSGCACQVGNWDKSTSAASDTVSLGITPQAVFVVSACNIPTSSYINDERRMFGASDGTNNRVVTTTYQGTSGDLTYQYWDTTNSICIPGSVNSTATAGTIGSFGSSQFVASYSTHDNIATEICYVAFGSSAGGYTGALTSLPVTAADTDSVTQTTVEIDYPAYLSTLQVAANTPYIAIQINCTVTPNPVTASANIALIGTTITGTTQTITPSSLNVTTVSPPVSFPYLGLTGIATFTANIADISITVDVEQTATLNAVENIPTVVNIIHVIGESIISSCGTGGPMLWSNAASWDGGVMPDDEYGINILSGDVMYFDVDQSEFAVGLTSVWIDGELRFPTQSPLTGTTITPLKVNPHMVLADGVQILGAGGFYCGNSATDPIRPPDEGSSSRATITSMGGTDYLIDIIETGFFGWYDTTTYSFFAGACAGSETTIPLTSQLLLQDGDEIVIGNTLTHGVSSDVEMEKYPVAAYTAQPPTITLQYGLSYSHDVGDCVARASRPIKITGVNAGVIAPTTRCIGFEGVCTEGIIPLPQYQDTLSIRGCTVFDTPLIYYTAPTANGMITVENSTVIGTPSGGALVGECGVPLKLNNCVVLGCPTGIASTDGISATGIVMQNTNIGMYEITNSALKNCTISGNHYGTANGAGNVYISSTFAHNDVDFYSAASATLYDTTLQSMIPTSYLHAAVVPAWSCIKDYGTGEDQRVWGAGGYGGIQNTVLYNGNKTWKFQIMQADEPLFWDTPFLSSAGKQVTVAIAAMKEFQGGVVMLQIIDPAHDPLFGFGDMPLDAVTLDDTISIWRTLSVSFMSTFMQPLVARVLVQNSTGTGNAYAYITAMEETLNCGGLYP